MLAHKSPHWSAFPYSLTAWFCLAGAIAQEVRYSSTRVLDGYDREVHSATRGDAKRWPPGAALA